MSEIDVLPPFPQPRLSASGRGAVAASILLAAMLLYLGWTTALMVYLIVVALGFVVGVPGGMRYQADVDAYLAKHPTLSRADLPWPADYTRLSRKQARRYAIRGLTGAVSYGVMMPVLLVLGALVSLRVLRMEALQHLYNDDEAA